MQSFQNVQDKQSLRAEAAIQGFLGADTNDSTYQSYRSVSRGGLEASVIIPAYGAAKALTEASKIRKVLPYALKRVGKKPLTHTRIKHVNFSRDYSLKTTKELKKSIKSFNRQIRLHKDKLSNPRKYYPNWDGLDYRFKNDLIRNNWPNEINNFQEQKNILQSFLNQRNR